MSDHLMNARQEATTSRTTLYHALDASVSRWFYLDRIAGACTTPQASSSCFVSPKPEGLVLPPSASKPAPLSCNPL